MNVLLDPGHAGGRTPLAALTAATLPGWLDTQPAATRRWIGAMGFSAQPGTWCGVPGNDGGVAQILAGVAEMLHGTPEVCGVVTFITGGAYVPKALRFLERSGRPRLDKPFEIRALRELARSAAG